MIDESMDKEQLKKPPQPWEFRSKPAWQRLIIMLGGIVVNVIVAMIFYAMALFVWGEKYLANENLTDGIWCTDSIALNIGLQNGDKIISIDDEKVLKFNDLMPKMLLGKTIELERNGETQYIEIPEDFVNTLIDKEPGPFIYPRIPTMVVEVAEESENLGIIQPKDKIIGLNGQP